MIRLKALGYEYKENGILLTVIYDINGTIKTAERFYEGATQIDFDWEEEAQIIAYDDLNG